MQVTNRQLRRIIKEFRRQSSRAAERRVGKAQAAGLDDLGTEPAPDIIDIIFNIPAMEKLNLPAGAEIETEAELMHYLMTLGSALGWSEPEVIKYSEQLDQLFDMGHDEAAAEFAFQFQVAADEKQHYDEQDYREGIDKMEITRRQLKDIIKEVEGSTKKYDDDSALRGGQGKLPDALQKGIIDKTVEDREEDEEEEREEKNESVRITRRQLRRIIKEEAYDCLQDYRLGGLTYQEYKDCLKRFEEIESQGGGYPRYQRKTSYVGAEANQELIATIENVLAARPNNFLSSILGQLQRGRGLSGKQKAIVRKIVAKHDPTAVALFEVLRPSKKQLRRIIREAIDVLNTETGELLIFDDVGEVSADGHTIGADAPEAAARDILRRLQITPIDSEIDGDIETIEVSPEDWAVMDVELRGKRRYRKNKREQERLDINNLRAKVDQWAADAGGDYAGDNPGVDMQDVAWDLAAAAQYSFEPDEWEELVWEIGDGSEDELITYIADMVVG